MVQKLVPTNSGKWILGLTGGFGSGKTTAAHLFEELGACVVDADTLGHEVLMKGGPRYAEVISLFKETVRPETGELDRRKIADIIFHDAVRRKKLEDIIHPYVFQRLIEEANETEEKIIILEVPLLFETGFDRFCDQTIVVQADEPVIHSRLREKGFSKEEIKARQGAQLSSEEKARKADIIINNSGTLEETRRKVEKIWKELHTVLKGEK